VIVTIGLGGKVTLPLNTLVAKELDLRGTFRFHSEFAVAVAFLNRGLIDGRPVVSNIVDFNQAHDAFVLAGDKRQSMKVQLAFDRELV
jgi:L-idonate 5-dehydrogenase